MTALRTTCPYCGVGCGVAVTGAAARIEDYSEHDPQINGVQIHGDKTHPANSGRLCSKGAALGATLDEAQRLTVPLIHQKPAEWDTALDLVAEKFAAAIAQYGPDSVAFYLSGQFLTEDYYVANKLMKGFIGSANIDTNSRLCMASTVAGHIRAFGEDVVPGIYDDWEQADLVVLVGSNTAWCHPVLHQRLQAARALRGTRVVVIDPRRTATAEAADLHLPIAAGSDVRLFNGLLSYLARTGAIDPLFIAQHTTGWPETLALAEAQSADIDQVAAVCGIDPEALETFFTWFSATERVLTVFSQGVNQARDGTDRVNAIINCHLATGRIGRPGMGPFSVTGQPNAMGGREVGGLANQLAAHLDVDTPSDRDALQSFWRSPVLPQRPGLKAVEMFEAVADGRIKAIWIAATNPAASMPRAGAVANALRACPFVVVADCWETDTTALAHVVLPAAGWGEKDGTVTNSERCISRQRPFRRGPGQARPDWWMFCQLASRLGHSDAFDFASPAAIFREHATLSAHANSGRRIFNIGALASLEPAAYEALRPMRWPLPPGTAGEGGRLFAQGGFPTPDGKARFIPLADAPMPTAGDPKTPEPFSQDAFILNTGRVRDQWHTMTRTGLVPELAQHTSEPTVSISPFDAHRMGIESGSLVEISTPHGTVQLHAELRHEQRRGEIFTPIHWSKQFAQTGPVAQLMDSRRDPFSGQPALKSTVARLTLLTERWHAFLLRRDKLAPPPDAGALWVRIPLEKGVLFRLTGRGALPKGPELTALIDSLLHAASAEQIEMTDLNRGVLRAAALRDGILDACLFLAPTRDNLPGEAALVALLGSPIDAAARTRLLAGRLASPSNGRRICVCFGVDEGAVRHAAVTHRLRTAADIGGHLRAGTNCGSCIPELEKILRDVTQPAL